jgi:uncharacterized protein (TIGR02186 family)
VLFGTIELDTPAARRRNATYDLVVTVTGPRQTVVTRLKERVLGIWTNTTSRTFINVPTYLAVLSTAPFDKVANPELLRRLQIGLDNFLLPQQIGPDVADVVRDDPFRVNFVRLKKEHRLYVEQVPGVTLLTSTVFRAQIPLPAVAPIGAYDVDIKLFADGTLLTNTMSAFEIVKVGFEQFVASAARQHGILYGLATSMLAFVTGWLASVVFRRD